MAELDTIPSKIKIADEYPNDFLQKNRKSSQRDYSIIECVSVTVHEIIRVFKLQEID
jgi:hypothetical protein